MRLRGELTGSRCVRYATKTAAIRPRGLKGPLRFPRSPPHGAEAIRRPSFYHQNVLRLQDFLHAETVRHSCEHTFVRSLETREEALRLVTAGLNDCEIARRLDVPRTTIRDWRNPSYVPATASSCPMCGERSRSIVLDAEIYAELLGLYIGDGHITNMIRTQRLRLFLDAKYPG